MVPRIPFNKFINSINIELQSLSTLHQQNAVQTLTISKGSSAEIGWTETLSLSPLSSMGEFEMVGPYAELAYEYFRDQLPVLIEGSWFDAWFDYQFELDADSVPQVALTNLYANLQALDIREKASTSLLASISNASLSDGQTILLLPKSYRYLVSTSILD